MYGEWSTSNSSIQRFPRRWSQSHLTIFARPPIAIFPPGIFLYMSVTISSTHYLKQAQQLSWNSILEEIMPTLLKPGKWSTPTPNRSLVS